MRNHRALCDGIHHADRVTGNVTARISKTGSFGHVKAVPTGGDSPAVIQTMRKDRLAFADLEGMAGAALGGA